MDYLQTYRELHRNPTNRLLHSIGIPAILLSIILFFFDWRWGLGVFLFGWLLQFVGHYYEGKSPAFFSNFIFFLIGPYWWLRKVLGLEK